MGFTLPSFWRAATPPNTSALNEQRALDATATLELEGAQAPQSKTIADGSISPTAAYVIVDTEGSAAADDLDIINPVLSASENLHTGMLVNLKAADSWRVVTVKNSSSANGINTYDGSDYVLSTTHWLKLQLRSGKWYEVEGRAMETALAAATAAAAASTPATTTARGIGRVATSDDLVDGATINNGPAFFSAGDAAIKTWIKSLYGDIGDLAASLATSKVGYILCNGGLYSRTTYAGLFALIGTAFGAGDGSTTFKVPDFRGRTIQGANANLMAVLSAGLPNVTGTLGSIIGSVGGSPASTVSGVFAQVWSGTLYNAGGGNISAVDISLARGNSIYGASTTVQPPAIATNIFIKY